MCRIVQDIGILKLNLANRDALNHTFLSVLRCRIAQVPLYTQSEILAIRPDESWTHHFQLGLNSPQF